MSGIRLVTLGHGYSARAFVRRVQPASVTGTTRSAAKVEALYRTGVVPVVVNGEMPETLRDAVRSATHVLVSAAPEAEGCPFLHPLERDFARAPALQWVGYISTVGVYGDHGGGEVDERSACRPTADRGIWRLEAEGAWTALGRRIGVPVAIFRLAGIYGPGRNQFVSLAEGRAKRIIKPGQVFNRIHVDDIAATVEASTVRPAARVYNVADDEPAPPEEPIEFAARLMGVEPPPPVPFEAAQMSEMARSFYGEVKRIANRRIHEELGVDLAYPTYREGLTELWESGRWREKE